MQLHPNANLKDHHTFAIEQSCHFLVEIESVQDLIEVYQSPQWHNLPKLILGKGSNVLFTSEFQGVVLSNQIKGLQHTQDENYHYLHISGGEDWPSLVEWTVKQNIAGLENLALIPGCAGSAPIQNIGAYGVEFQDVCHYVDYLCLESFTVKRLTAQECLFGYRDSIFKHQLYGKAIVVAIGLILQKNWQPTLNYGPLQDLNAESCTLLDIYQCICATRQAKLPDPRILGNAGSFFKNPVISLSLWEVLLQRYPDIVSYPVNGGRKIAAGWLIDQCGLKGIRVGGAQVHPKQALVIVNSGDATAEDVIQLASEICKTVYSKYSIYLEHEVRFLDNKKETTLQQIMGKQD
ncbi:UDP-N-acetylmuramate dehydrogenase [Vibrio aestuarianus]|uniref:UDP-N-acetylmuramate dehydrogenase n=1 Tax=Vibrio aestuarianus TaxID=28171 RepID=UPI001445DE93|nr:UDP-N-acetylmuramate dehydrogenase [Vibrio aestuarianus]MDE1215371.1 UDP-N-acetylmuramate dehydrogenase [Vibrio aestuarianus]MDE1218052.1 UDP-N-acetylmuramate dehydrogenase [Vibrio aestuarianus]MDE1226589.1 UDP-N-acetylmuramate dehydrogenase [Vibrio aestuarianus]MDE1262472.1 UDP-N-acetylmuramate dehydrogenase [Vibrio aestuarianus]MDE1269590.1 UDP-N-acetylmuramate dehydrogenase [Vibrio aestuarianus]